MFLRPNRRTKDGKDHTYWSLVETVRTPDGPRQRTLCYLPVAGWCRETAPIQTGLGCFIYMNDIYRRSSPATA